MISDTELDKLIDAEAKATKGEWKLAAVAATVGKSFHVFVYVQHVGEVCSCSPNSGLYSNRCGLDNLDFIAAIRNAAPSILAELRASREIIAKLPRTADEKPVVPGVEYPCLWRFYSDYEHEGNEWNKSTARYVGHAEPHVDYKWEVSHAVETCEVQVFSTEDAREAALASKGK